MKEWRKETLSIIFFPPWNFAFIVVVLLFGFGMVSILSGSSVTVKIISLSLYFFFLFDKVQWLQHTKKSGHCLNWFEPLWYLHRKKKTFLGENKARKNRWDSFYRIFDISSDRPTHSNRPKFKSLHFANLSGKISTKISEQKSKGLRLSPAQSYLTRSYESSLTTLSMAASKKTIFIKKHRFALNIQYMCHRADIIFRPWTDIDDDKPACFLWHHYINSAPFENESSTPLPPPQGKTYCRKCGQIPPVSRRP